MNKRLISQSRNLETRENEFTDFIVTCMICLLEKKLYAQCRRILSDDRLQGTNTRERRLEDQKLLFQLTVESTKRNAFRRTLAECFYKTLRPIA